MIFLLKTGPIWPKTEIFAQILAFWPIWSHGRPKNDGNKVPRWFSVRWIPKLLFPPVEIRKFVPKYAVVVILGQILAFLALLVTCPTGKMQKRCRGVFSITWVPKLLLPPVKIMIFGQKKAKFGPKYAFLGTYRLCWFIWCPFD